VKLHINKWRSLWWSISAAIIALGITSMIISWQITSYPLRPSLDFIGGTRLLLGRDCSKTENCNKPIDINLVRDIVRQQGLGDSSIQIIADKESGKNDGLLVRTKTLDVDQRKNLQDRISAEIGSFSPNKNQIDTVGPTLGLQLFNSGIVALIVSFIGIVIYLGIRFQWDYSVFAIVAILHDLLVTVGVFSVLGLFLNMEVGSLFIVALLTITGFSVNDTVVIYDRIRENLKNQGNIPFNEIVDNAVNQSITRSVNTTLTTLMSLVAIFLFGGETLRNFALALIIGFSVGAYSSIFIASTLLAWWRERKGESNINYTPKPIDANVDNS